MPKQRRMNKQARLELVRSYREEYMSAGRGRRGEILSCLQGSTNYNRKYLIRLLRGKYKHHARRKQRGRHYGATLDDVLRAIFEAHGELRLTPQVEEQGQLRQSTNPRLLRRQIYAQIERLFHLPNAVPGITGDVHDTLTFPLSFWKGGGSLK